MPAKQRPPEEITLNSKQLKGLDILSKIDVDSILANKKLSWVGKILVWLDVNIFENSTRLIMHLLEIVGVVAIYVIISDVQVGLHKVSIATTDLELARAKTYLDSLVQLAPALATMIATICGALPSIIGLMRSVHMKWKNNSTNGNGNGNGNGSPVPPPDKTVEGA